MEVKILKEWARDIVIALAAAVLIMQVIRPTVVVGHSMEPTLFENNYVFLSKQQYTFSDIEPGQIIVIKSHLKNADSKDKLLIKRVIAVPGDKIEIMDGAVYLNGEISRERYIKEQYTMGYMEETEIPEGMVFVMGDNRQHSLDSRSPEVGLVSEKDVVGMAFFRVWPFSQFGFLK